MINLEVIESNDLVMLGQYNYNFHHVSVGRSFKNHIILRDEGLSSRHCLFRLSQKGLVFECKKPYLLNEKKVEGTVLLKNQDIIQIGDSQIRVNDFDPEKAIDPEGYFTFLEQTSAQKPALNNLFLTLEEEYIHQMELEANVLEE